MKIAIKLPSLSFELLSAQDKVACVLSPDIDTDTDTGEWSGYQGTAHWPGHWPHTSSLCLSAVTFYIFTQAASSMLAAAKQTGDFDLNVRPFLSSRNCIEGQQFWVQY